MKAKVITVIFFLVGLVNLASHIADAPSVTQMSKALLMPLLIYLVFVLAEGSVGLPRLLLTIGLIFSWAGDMLMIYADEEVFFLTGLSMFLIAQLIYATVMYQSAYQKPELKVNKLIPILIYGVVLLGVVIPAAGKFGIPVFAYAICILGMVSIAISREGLTSDESYRWTVIGAVLFVLSDSLIAIDKFVIEIPLVAVFVMGTYIVAQYLIVKGVMSHPGG